MITLVVLVEGLIALALTLLAWRWRGPGLFLRRFLLGVLLAVAWCPFVHGFCFGILGVEGFVDNPDPAGLALAGIFYGGFLGLPLGILLGLTLGIAALTGLGHHVSTPGRRR